MDASPTAAAEGAAAPFRGFDVTPTEPPEELVWDGTGFSPAPTPMRINRRRVRDNPPNQPTVPTRPMDRRHRRAVCPRAATTWQREPLWLPHPPPPLEGWSMQQLTEIGLLQHGR